MAKNINKWLENWSYFTLLSSTRTLFTTTGSGYTFLLDLFFLCFGEFRGKNWTLGPQGVGPKYFRYKLPHSRRGVGGLQEGLKKKFPNIDTWPHPGSLVYIYIYVYRGEKTYEVGVPSVLVHFFSRKFWFQHWLHTRGGRWKKTSEDGCDLPFWHPRYHLMDGDLVNFFFISSSDCEHI